MAHNTTRHISKPKRKPRRKMTKTEQSERFKQTARELGADESGEAFERVLRKIVPPKPRA